GPPSKRDRKPAPQTDSHTIGPVYTAARERSRRLHQKTHPDRSRGHRDKLRPEPRRSCRRGQETRSRHRQRSLGPTTGRQRDEVAAQNPPRTTVTLQDHLQHTPHTTHRERGEEPDSP